ncbi:MAG: hypothetical protein KAS39_00635 [Actinomycetia bacterium]|nr:hypothetical protein [Actinomycetes bacterium]
MKDINDVIDNSNTVLEEINKADSGVQESDSVIGITVTDKAAEIDEADKEDALEIVLKAGVLYRINSNCWSAITSRVPEEQVKAPKEILSGLKTIINTDRLGPFRFWKTAGERELKKFGYNFLGLRGVYFIPKAFIPVIERKLKLCTEKALEAKADFIANYEVYKDEWRDTVIDICEKKDITIEQALAYLDDELYPSAENLEGRFRFSYRKFFISVPDPSMGILDDKEYQEEVKKQKEEAAEFLDNCLAGLAKKFYDIISKIQDKIKKGESVRPNTLQALSDYTTIFDQMNITNNQELAGFVIQAKKIFSGVEAKDFKEDDFRKQIEAGLTEIVTNFKTKSDQKVLRDIDF